MNNLMIVKINRAFGILVILALVIFVYSGFKIQSVTPPFQGPDEIAHYTRLLTHQLPADLKCGFLPNRVFDLWNAVVFLPYHPEHKLNVEGVARIDSITGRLENDQFAYAWQSFDDSACPYASTYIWPVRMVQQIFPKNFHLVDWVLQVRHGVFILSIFIWCLAGLFCIKGRLLIKQTRTHFLVIKVASVWAFVLLLLLPQTVWISGILNTDYLFLPLGSLLALQFFWRIKFGSELVFVLALMAAALKPLYLPIWLTVMLVHYLLNWGYLSKILPLLKKTYLWVGFFLSVFVFLVLAYNLSNVLQPYLKIFKTKGSLGLPHFFFSESAFAQFGWLDSSLAPNSLRLMLFPFACLLVLVGLQAVLIFIRARSFKIYQATWWDSFIFVSLFFLGLIGLCSLTIALNALADWCQVKHGISTIGCGYQKRYELPFYALFLTLYLIIIFNFLFKTAAFKKTKWACIGFLLLLQMGVSFVVLDRAHSLLKERYFSTDEAASKYAEIYWRSWLL